MTLGLSIISNKPQVKDVIEKYSQYFDKVYVTIADKSKQLFYDIEKLQSDDIQVTYFKWVNDFSKAREFNREQIKTDYWLWLDDDDEIDHPERLRDLVTYMQAKELDCLYLKYNYAQNELNEGVGDHWRERLLRTDHDFKWADVPVHETVIAPYANHEKSPYVSIIHHKSEADIQKSSERNLKLLEKHYAETKDPRSAHYLGQTYMGMKEYEKAIPYFLDHIRTSGWDEESYRSWCKIAEAELLLGRPSKAISATNGAVELLPNYPDAYYVKAMIYSEVEAFDKCIEWLKVAVSKPEPDTLSITDPTLYKYRGLFLGALAYLQLGKTTEAWATLQEVLRRQPDYPIANELKQVFEEAYLDGEAIERSKWLLRYMRDNGNPAKLLQALPYRIVSDPRLNAERATLTPAKKWSNGSIVYFCGQALEPWGADTLDKGMGGSEEAVVYLSRELAKLGHEVTVFNDREEPHQDGAVSYQPWVMLNPYDTFDTFIAWRAPEFVKGVKARRKFVDLHDTVEPERVYAVAKEVDKFFVKSQYHRSLYPDLPDDKFVVIGNGIVKEHFND